LVSNASVTVTSGQYNNFLTTVLPIDYTNFVSTNVSFYNGREKKTVKGTQLDIKKLAAWNANSTNILKTILPFGDVRIVYVADYRTQTASTEPGIKLVNGDTILPQGLTVASPHPVYIQGHYNCTNSAHLGTPNTSSSLPASIVADAITILSSAWNDATATSSSSLSSRVPNDTTVNAAFITGIVQTSSTNGYSGGVENLPRFLEDWGSSSGSGSGGRTFTYNGSMVVMFESKYATAPWVNIGGYYNPPIRNWSFDTNFRNPLKLPPGAPAAYSIMRGTWQVIAAK
jgi:hypothetical protein